MILDKIIEKKAERVKELKNKHPLEVIKNEALSKCNGDKFKFFASIKKEDSLTLIAEVKKASPSKGIISEKFDYLNIASIYEKNGVAAMSVLTEEDFFLGSSAYLVDIRKNAGIPILRKDFVIDEYQIYEAKILGADAVLLILRILKDYELAKFYNIAQSLGLDCLFEAHTEDEVKRAVSLGARIIGINNRDLDTFTVDLKMSEKLIEYIPDSVIKVSESGINTPEDMKRLAKAGFDSVLAGEVLMRSGNISEKIASLLEGGAK